MMSAIRTRRKLPRNTSRNFRRRSKSGCWELLGQYLSEGEHVMEKETSNFSNGHATDGMDIPRIAEAGASDYITSEEQATARSENTSAYTEPEENLVKFETMGLGAITVRSRPPKDDWFR